MSACQEALARADLVVLENVANDLAHSIPRVTDRLRAVWREIRAGGVLAIIDLNYNCTLELMHAARCVVGESGTVHVMDYQPRVHDVPWPLPRILREHLFTGEDGLIYSPRANALGFVARKHD